MGSQLALKSRIASTQSLEKIFNAQEMIASSHIARAREVALNAKPYSDAIFDAVTPKGLMQLSGDGPMIFGGEATGAVPAFLKAVPDGLFFWRRDQRLVMF